MARYYTAPDAATDDLYEALMFWYWNDKERAVELIMAASQKYEQGGYAVKAKQKAETPTSFPAEDDIESPLSDDTRSASTDDIDYDQAAAIGDNYPWDGWRFH